MVGSKLQPGRTAWTCFLQKPGECKCGLFVYAAPGIQKTLPNEHMILSVYVCVCCAGGGGGGWLQPPQGRVPIKASPPTRENKEKKSRPN